MERTTSNSQFYERIYLVKWAKLNFSWIRIIVYCAQKLQHNRTSAFLCDVRIYSNWSFTLQQEHTLQPTHLNDLRNVMFAQVGQKRNNIWKIHDLVVPRNANIERIESSRNQFLMWIRSHARITNPLRMCSIPCAIIINCTYIPLIRLINL